VIPVGGPSLVRSFSLDVPAGSYRVEFFRNPSGVDVPNGEGEVFAGFKNVTHGGGGSRPFSATITGVSNPSEEVTVRHAGKSQQVKVARGKSVSL